MDSQREGDVSADSDLPSSQVAVGSSPGGGSTNPAGRQKEPSPVEFVSEQAVPFDKQTITGRGTQRERKRERERRRRMIGFRNVGNDTSPIVSRCASVEFQLMG